MKAVFARKNVTLGLIFIAVGLAAALLATKLDRGTAFQMGPGYFPLLLSLLLAFLGLLNIVQGMTAAPVPFGPMPWRGLVLISAGLLIFGLTARGLGLALSTFLLAFIAGMASRRTSLSFSLILAAGLTGFAVLLFSYGLRMPNALIGPWLKI